MINVTLLFKNEKKIGFKIQGHANFDKHGVDIVCAAVSMLAYTSINTLDYYGYDVKFKDDNDTMKVCLNKEDDKSEIIFNTFEIGINTLLANYNEYINLNYEEV